MIPRTLAEYLRRDAGYYPVVSVTGPRQSGKTTLVRSVFPDHRYVSLESPESRSFAREDPKGFLRSLGEGAVIDEAQRVPELFSYIQVLVDESDAVGRFVLTGSQNFMLMESVSQSLAGRTGLLHLLPFSRAELEVQHTETPGDPESLFGNRRSSLELWQTLYQGFYPRIHDRGIPPDVWLPDYVETYLQRDVRSLVNIGDLERFERFLALTAGRIGQLLNYSSLASDAGVSVDTARRWLSVLKAGFVIFLLKPHHRNLNKRVVKSPKLYYYDTGLACHLLGMRAVQHARLHPLRGQLFENLVVAEAAKAYLHHRRDPPLYFWRDRTGHEVDLIIEEGADLYPVEIKAGETISRDMFDSLRWWCREAGQPDSTATLVYAGAEAHTRNGIAVRPWFSV